MNEIQINNLTKNILNAINNENTKILVWQKLASQSKHRFHSTIDMDKHFLACVFVILN